MLKIVEGGISQSHALQDVLPGIAFCDLENEFAKYETAQAPLPPGMAKLFKITQLIVQYLLHSQRKLTEAIQTLQVTCNDLKQVRHSFLKDKYRYKLNRMQS